MERRKTMGFKNDSVYRTRRILCLVIFVLLLSIIVVCISSPAAEHVQTTVIRTARRAQSRPHRHPPHRSLRSRIRPHCKRNLLRRIILRQLKQQKPRLLPTESRSLLRKAT